MKKFLSCVLALALVFSLMSVTVFAAADEFDPHPNTTKPKGEITYNVVGNEATGNTTDDGSYTDGDTSANGSASADVTINFEKTIGDGQGGTTTVDIRENRYAVDITYQSLVIDLGRVVEIKDAQQQAVEYSYIWNVNTYSYDLVANNNTVVTENGNVNVNGLTVDVDKDYVITDAFTISNHSDRQIYYVASIADDGANNDGLITFTLVRDAEDVATLTEKKVDAVNVGDNAPKTSAVTIKAAPAGDTNWLNVINSLTEKQIATGSSVGTITVTITPTPTPTV